MMRSLLLSSILVLAAACGGKSSPATSSTTTAGAGAGSGEAATHEHDFPPTIAAFHDQMAPLWHQEPGPARTEATCGVTGELDQKLEEVQNAGAPAGVDGAAWTAKLDELRIAMSVLNEDCINVDGEKLDENFQKLHDAFHALIALLPGETAHDGTGHH